MRIVSLNCSNTEIVCALGCEQYLVGVDDHSDYPEHVVSALPRVGPDLEINIDAVARLNPDLVLASLTVPGHEKVIEGLERAQLPYLAPEPIFLADVSRDILTIGERLNVMDAARDVVRRFEVETGLAARSFTSGSGSSGSSSSGPSILVQWWPKPVIAPGAHSWVNGMLDAAGGRNPLAHEDIKSRPIDDNEVAEINPDAIVISWCGVKPEKYRPEVVYRNPVWADLDFVRKKRVFCVPEAWMGRLSQRLGQGCQALREVVSSLSPH